METTILAEGTPELALPPDRLEVVPDLLDTPLHGLVVRVHALLAARHEPWAFPDIGRVDPLAEEGHLVLQEGELDLELRFADRRTLGEQLEDHAKPVVALDAEVAFEVVVHRRPELPVEHDEIDPALLHARVDLHELSPTDERSGIRPVPPLDDDVDDAMTRGLRQGAELRGVGREGDEERIHDVVERQGHDKGFQRKWGGGGPPSIPAKLTLSKVNSIPDRCRSAAGPRRSRSGAGDTCTSGTTRSATAVGARSSGTSVLSAGSRPGRVSRRRSVPITTVRGRSCAGDGARRSRRHRPDDGKPHIRGRDGLGECASA